jgi:hypothetical protein
LPDKITEKKKQTPQPERMEGPAMAAQPAKGNRKREKDPAYERLGMIEIRENRSSRQQGQRWFAGPGHNPTGKGNGDMCRAGHFL